LSTVLQDIRGSGAHNLPSAENNTWNLALQNK
jgi:hypothetical protein